MLAAMNTTCPLALIVAVAENSVIGVDNRMPWHLPEELRHFRALTLGKPVIMGRKTWDSLGRPLPGRLNLVVSRQPGLCCEGAESFTSLAAAVSRGQQWAAERGVAEVMLIGGAQLFAEGLPLARRLYPTRVALAPVGDVFLPVWPDGQWQQQSARPHAASPGGPAWVAAGSGRLCGPSSF